MTVINDMPTLTRDGSSLRNNEELTLVFIGDVRHIASEEDPGDYADATEISGEATRAYVAEDFELLDTLCYEAEVLLRRMGFSVDWNDGYEIYREA